MSPGALEGRTALVTGAGGGVGRGIALAFGRAGAAVVIAARRAVTGDETAALIEDAGGRALSVQCDVTDRGAVHAAVDAAVGRFGGLDVVVHNATSGRSNEFAALEDVDDELWDDVLDVAVRGTRLCAQAAYPHLRRRPGAFIVLTSAAGIEGSANLPQYAAAKGAQRGLAKSLAREWGPDGIRVNCIAPVAETPALTEYFETSPAARDRVLGRAALGRVGDPERDIGAAAVFLAGDAGGFVTGQTLVVDGGSFIGL